MKGKYLVGLCGCHIDITEEDLGFEEVECQKHGTLNSCPATWDEVDAQNGEACKVPDATHVRIMAKGEDGTVWCIRNGVPNDDLVPIIITGYEANYPEATIWAEDEESTIPGYHARLLAELDY
jgi:hypothetical protein